MISKLHFGDKYHLISLSGAYKGLTIVCEFTGNQLRIIIVPFHPCISENGDFTIPKARNLKLTPHERLMGLAEGLSYPHKSCIINDKAQMLLEACPRQYTQLLKNQILMTNRILNGGYALPNVYKDTFNLEEYQQNWKELGAIVIKKQ